MAASAFLACFGTIQLYMTCWARERVRRAAAAPARRRCRRRPPGWCSCAVRQAEIELTMYDSLPATRPWLFDAAFQENTSLVIVSLNSRAMNSTAATVCVRVEHDLLVRVLLGGAVATTCSARADHVRVDLLGHPRPIWTPLRFLISAPPRSRSSQVVGPFGSPTGSHRRLAVVAGVGHPAGRVRVELAGGRVEAGLAAQLQLRAPAACSPRRPRPSGRARSARTATASRCTGSGRGPARPGSRRRCGSGSGPGRCGRR